MAVTAIAAAVAVPVTVVLASHELGPLLSEPAGAFLLAVVSAVAAAAIVPSLREERHPSSLGFQPQAGGRSRFRLGLKPQARRVQPFPGLLPHSLEPGSGRAFLFPCNPDELETTFLLDGEDLSPIRSST